MSIYSSLLCYYYYYFLLFLSHISVNIFFRHQISEIFTFIYVPISSITSPTRPTPNLQKLVFPPSPSPSHAVPLRRVSSLLRRISTFRSHLRRLRPNSSTKHGRRRSPLAVVCRSEQSLRLFLGATDGLLVVVVSWLFGVLWVWEEECRGTSTTTITAGGRGRGRRRRGWRGFSGPGSYERIALGSSGVEGEEE